MSKVKAVVGALRKGVSRQKVSNVVAVKVDSAFIKSKVARKHFTPKLSVAPGKKPVVTIQSSADPLIKSIFGGGKHSKTYNTAIEKMDLVREGVNKTELQYLKERIGLDYDDLAAILPATRATLISKKGTQKFNPSISEAIVSVADIYSYGYEVFEDEVRFNEWMFRPLQALNGEIPFSLLDNQFGREEVRNLIGRIEYGVYS